MDTSTVYIFSDPNFLAVNILENLLAKNCLVNIITSDKKTWEEKTLHISNRSKFWVTSSKDVSKLIHPNYAIFCGGFINKEEAFEGFKNFIRSPILSGSKTLAIFPFEASENIKKVVPRGDESGVIYLGDLFGPRMDLGSDLLAPRLVNEILGRRTITLGVGEVLYPLFCPDAARTITKWIFSFGPYGKEIFLLGPETSGSDFWKYNLRIIPDVKISYESDVEIRIVPRGYEVKKINTNIPFALTETYRWFWQIETQEKFKITKPQKVKTTKKRNPLTPRQKALRRVLFITVPILTLPIITLILSGTALLIASKFFLKGDVEKSLTAALSAKTFASVGKNESRVFGYVPILGRPYKELEFVSGVAEQGADIFVNTAPLVNSSGNLFTKVLGDKVYDSHEDAQGISAGLSYLYQSASLMELTTKTKADEGILSAKKLLQKVNFEKVKRLAKEGSDLANALPDILGQDESTKYLVLFQNNEELRPTGGFIGSFAIASFDSGRINELNVSDVYSADGQLRGHVEPPTPIKKYLGEANWYLRDSNWDPDFTTSAKRAEWFLDKEIDTQVDGVVSVDLQVVKDILKETGPVFLADYNLDITSENLYEKTQSEVQDEFFPGTHKKASFLTALSRNLLSEVSKLSGSQKIAILKSFYKNMEERHIQVFMHDEAAQGAVSGLGYSGEVGTPTCGDSCYPDFVSEVEANVGVNKANYFIERSQNLRVSINGNVVRRDLTIDLKNSANPALGEKGRYKAYVRALLPQDAEILSVKSVTGASEEVLGPEILTVQDRKEVGIPIEVFGGQSKKIVYSWQSTVSTIPSFTEYGLYFRKQAGTESDKLRITVEANGRKLATNPQFTLTGRGVYSYNTNLARDFFSRISW